MPARFQHADAFRSFLPENGVPGGAGNYITWMNRAADRLGRELGAEDLSSDDDVEARIAELHEMARRDRSFRFEPGSKEESDQRSTFRKYVQMVEANYGGLFSRKETRISPARFRLAYERFQKIHREKDGRPFTSFSDPESFTHGWESYKRRVLVQGQAALELEKWRRDEIGQRSLIDRVISAIEVPGNNLVRWEARNGDGSEAHVRLLKARDNRKQRQDLGQILFDFYKRRNIGKDAFESLTRVLGRRYELLGYLFFLADPSRFLPLRTRTFGKVFAELGLDLKLERQCGWENYQAFNDAIREVRSCLRAEGVQDASFLDAHSFCWILGRHEATETVKTLPPTRMVSFDGTFRSGEVSRDFVPKDDAAVRDMQAEAQRRQASGQVAEEIALEAERDRLKDAGKLRHMDDVEYVGNKPSLGYDIKSTDSDGTERFIEVKNVTGGARFFLTENEWLNSRSRENFWFYLVSENPRRGNEIEMVPASVLGEQHLRPVQYLVNYSKSSDS